MEKTNEKYSAYIQILKEELIPAMGCTEPIALAYAAAVAKKVLGQMPERVAIGASGSIIKNVKSVIVPNTDHLRVFRQQQRQVLLQVIRIKNWKLSLMLQKTR